MPDLQEQLQSILGDPQAMSQITAIAQALTGGPAGQTSPPAPSAPAQGGGEFVPADTPIPSEESSQPGQTPDLSALLSSLGRGQGLNIDPKLIQIALQVFSEYSAQDDQKAALLSALKPFLREERLEKMEKAEKIARMSRVVRVAIQLLREEGESHV